MLRGVPGTRTVTMQGMPERRAVPGTLVAPGFLVEEGRGGGRVFPGVEEETELFRLRFEALAGSPPAAPDTGGFRAAEDVLALLVAVVATEAGRRAEARDEDDAGLRRVGVPFPLPLPGPAPPLLLTLAATLLAELCFLSLGPAAAGVRAAPALPGLAAPARGVTVALRPAVAVEATDLRLATEGAGEAARRAVGGRREAAAGVGVEDEAEVGVEEGTVGGRVEEEVRGREGAVAGVADGDAAEETAGGRVDEEARERGVAAAAAAEGGGREAEGVEEGTVRGAEGEDEGAAVPLTAGVRGALTGVRFGVARAAGGRLTAAARATGEEAGAAIAGGREGRDRPAAPAVGPAVRAVAAVATLARETVLAFDNLGCLG